MFGPSAQIRRHISKMNIPRNTNSAVSAAARERLELGLPVAKAKPFRMPKTAWLAKPYYGILALANLAND